MIELSLCMIVKNETKVLNQCLSCVNELMDEIVIVDTGSKDNTKEIAAKYTDKIYDFKWINDFSAARNFAFSKATKNYIMWLDADDILLPDDVKKLKELKETLPPNIDSVLMKYNYAFDSNGNVSMSFYRNRIVKADKHFQWIEPIHEYIAVNGKALKSNIVVTHTRTHSNSVRNLEMLREEVIKKRKISPRSQFYYARELFDNRYYRDAIAQFKKFLDLKDTNPEERIQACFYLSLCYSQTNQKDHILPILLKSFEYSIPRAEICCRIGVYFEEMEDYYSAIFWYDLATKLDPNSVNLGTILEDYWGFIPHIQLSICYYEIHNIEEALRHLELAAAIKPDSDIVKKNQDFFKKYKKKFSIKM